MTFNIKYAFVGGGGLATIAGLVAGINHLSKGKPIRQELLSQGEKLITLDDGHDAVFSVFKEEQELIDAINRPEITSSSTDEVGGQALRAWCNEKLDTYRTDHKTKELIVRYCTEAPSTIEEKLIKKGKKQVTDWSNKLLSIKTETGHEKLLQDLTAKNSGVTSFDNSKAADTLKDWCNENKSKPLSESKVDDKEIKVNGRCFDEK